MAARPSVILIREWEQQMTGSRCCGRLERGLPWAKSVSMFPERRAVMERMGSIYRMLREQFGDAIDLEVIDPRNAFLPFILAHVCWSHRVGLRTAWRTLAGLPAQGVIVNGRLVDATDHPDPRRIVMLVAEHAPRRWEAPPAPPPILLVLAAVLALAGRVTGVSAQVDAFPGDEGPVLVRPFAGAGVQIEYLGLVIHVDPWSRGDYSTAEPADLILVTDVPADHLDPDLIRTLSTPGTTVIVPTTPDEARDAEGAERLRAVEGALVLRNDESLELAFPRAGTPPVGVEAVAMYDILPGEPFHAKGEGNGYVLTLGGLRIYLAGVTECTPEMLAVTDVDILFVPMNLPNGRMTPSVAADCVTRIGPRVVYPYHYREMPIDGFVEALGGEPIDVRVRDWYPPA
jgi:L-ascorbate metabolism protein UlaG (beta-lactamase superfamily)